MTISEIKLKNYLNACKKEEIPVRLSYVKELKAQIKLEKETEISICQGK